MALSKMTWDELNQLVGHKVSEPYKDFFAPMQLSKAQKRKRVRLANRLDDIFCGLLIEYFYADQYDTIVSSDIFERTREDYMNLIYGLGSIEYSDEYIFNHGTSVIANAILVLLRHRDDPYYYSEDRAMAIAENEANYIYEYDELLEAHERGMRYKTWHTLMDGKERESHAEVNGVTIPIDEPFELAGGYMLTPHDDSLGVSDDELANCRCTCSYS